MTRNPVAGALALAAVTGLGLLGTARAAPASYRVPLPCDAETVVPARTAEVLLVVCTDDALQALGLPDGRILRGWRARELATDAGDLSHATLSGDGRLVAASFQNGRLTVASVDGATPPRSLQLDFYPSRLRFSADGRMLWAGRLRIALEPRLRIADALPVSFADVADLAEAPRGDALAVAGQDTTLHVYDPRTFAPRAAYTDLAVEPLRVAYTPSGRALVVGVADGRVLVLAPGTLRLEKMFRTPQGTYPAGLWPLSETRTAVAYAPNEGGKLQLGVLDLKRGDVSPLTGTGSFHGAALHDGRVWVATIDGRTATLTPLEH